MEGFRNQGHCIHLSGLKGHTKNRALASDVFIHVYYFLNLMLYIGPENFSIWELDQHF